LNDQPYLLANDNGTQSVRALLFDLQGNLLGKGKVELEAYYSTQPGWAEQDPEYYWRSLGEACQQLWASLDIDRSQIRGVSLTTQRGSLINVDAEGHPLRPAMLWLDQRRAGKGSWPNPVLKAALRAMKLLEAVEYTITESESNWIRENQPEIWEKTHKFLFLSGFLTHRLVGEYVDSTGCTVGFVPFDYKTQAWAKPSDMKWKMFPMNPSLLPALVRPSEMLGYITKQASTETGIPAGLPLIAAAADKACEVLGSGCMSPEIACLSYGTTATVETTNTKYVEIVPFIPPYPSAVPGAYNTEVMIYRGF